MTTFVLGLMKDSEQAGGMMHVLDREGLERHDVDDSGGLIAALAALGVPGREAAIYAEGLRRGGAVVCVRAEDDMEAEHAAHLMMAHGSVDLEACAAGWRVESEVFGEQPAAPGRIYFRRGARRAGSAFFRGAVNDGPYTGPERRGDGAPYAGSHRRTD